MAYSYTEVLGTGSLQSVAIPFEFLDPAHVKVSIDGVDTTSFTWLNGSTVQLTAPAGSKVRARRSTSPTARLADYMDGTSLTEVVLDTDSKQAFFLAQETFDAAADVIAKSSQFDNAIAAANTSANAAAGSATLADGSRSQAQTIANAAAQSAANALASANLASPSKINGFRLTLTNGVPVTTSDVVAAGTVYAAPYTSNNIALYTASGWVTRISPQMSIALAGLAVSRPYDVFCFDNAGTPTLELLSWTNDTTRTAALGYQDGVLVKASDATRRYLGTFYTTGAAATEDSDANRLLWNYYHRVVRKMRRIDPTSSWTYSSQAWRYANGTSLNRLNFVIGVAEDCVSADLDARASSTISGPAPIHAIGLNSGTVPSNDSTAPLVSVCVPNAGVTNHAHYEGLPPAGFNYLSWLEYALGGTMAFNGTSTCAISGRVSA